jgi:hypothetical protein
MKDAVEANVIDLEQLARVPGIGPFRVQRDGVAILQALRTPEPAS